jgi:hypothetical protein
MTDDLSSLKDDMVAFILGHGMSRFQGYVTEDVHSVMWDPRDNPESWKDFVELAKKAGCAFLSMDEEILERDELDYLVQRLQQATYPSDDDIEEARWLRSFVNKTGFLQLGWPHQGIMFLYEVSTDWYERYQRLLDLVEDFGTPAVDGSDPTKNTKVRPRESSPESVDRLTREGGLSVIAQLLVARGIVTPTAEEFSRPARPSPFAYLMSGLRTGRAPARP